MDVLAGREADMIKVGAEGVGLSGCTVPDIRSSISCSCGAVEERWLSPVSIT